MVIIIIKCGGTVQAGREFGILLHRARRDYYYYGIVCAREYSTLMVPETKKSANEHKFVFNTYYYVTFVYYYILFDFVKTTCTRTRIIMYTRIHNII